MTVSIHSLKTMEKIISYSIVIEKSNGIWVNIYVFRQNGLEVRMQTICAVATATMAMATTPMVKACSVDFRAKCTNVAKAPLGEQLPNWINMIKLICLIH